MPDVSEFDELISTSKSQTASLLKEFEQFVYSNFDNFDLDKDGYLSKEELEAAIFEKNRTVKEVSILNFFLIRLKEIAASYDEGDPDSDSDCISKMDIQAYFSKLQ